MRVDRRGFTFIELMMVVTIMGLLVSIAVNRLVGTRDRSFLAAMRSDLRNFALAEESYFYDNDIYTPDVSLLQARGFTLSTGGSVAVNEATVLGWSATASHVNTPQRCYLFMGDAAPVGSADRAGEISCS
jgi:prepilin-type N-terminal cleavage/methylation domain-containing protein